MVWWPIGGGGRLDDCKHQHCTDWKSDNQMENNKCWWNWSKWEYRFVCVLCFVFVSDEQLQNEGAVNAESDTGPKVDTWE